MHLKNVTSKKKNMSIQRDLDELDKIETEIKSLRKRLSEMNKQKQLVELRVIDFLKNQDTHGVRYQNKAVLLEDRCIRSKKKKVEKFKDVKSILSKHGLPINEAMIGEILEAQRGQTKSDQILKVVERQ